MSNKTSGVPTRTAAVISRRKRVITMLEAQLKRGVKTARTEQDLNIFAHVPLTDKDITRIEKELAILKERV